MITPTPVPTGTRKARSRTNTRAIPANRRDAPRRPRAHRPPNSTWSSRAPNLHRIDTEKEESDMRKVWTTMFALSFCAVSQALAQQATSIDGQVTKVDPSASKVTIKHGPIKQLGMDQGMTMVYTAQDPAMLKSVKAGDKIKFDASEVNGQSIVTKIQKAK